LGLNLFGGHYHVESIMLDQIACYN
jgi:hypothetical protein